MAEINKIIKDARDVLVGKIPDPKAQVEQITIALMYKFMDAKDTESLELGGKASFFVSSDGELEKYSYSKIMETSNNIKKLEMYRKGLELLGDNLNLPDIFRSIFKNAYLPYNDAATAALFLKEIDKIPTENTELLGTAFEDLLAIMGSQGDAGQFRTPRHIIDFMVEVIKPKKSETVLDPACGTAGFLVSAFSYINKKNDLTINEKEKLKTNFRGYDISPDMVRLAKVNLFLHDFKDPKIDEYDTLTFKDNWKEKFDVILANPPFMTPKGGISPHELFTISANRSEVLFADYILTHLKKNGRAGIIVPEGIVFQSQNAYKILRKNLVNEGLYAVVSLPSGVFNPYSGVKTSILFLDKQIAAAAENILFIKIQNDGFDLGAQRRPTPEKNQLIDAITILSNYKKAILKGENVEEIITNDDFTTIAKKEKIGENGEYILAGDKYKEVAAHNSNYPMVELGEVCDYIRGLTYEKEDESPIQTKKIVLRANNINLHNGISLDDLKYLDEQKEYNNEKILKENDILICTSSGSKQHLGKVALIDKNCNFYFGGFMGVLRSNQATNPKYLFYNLCSYQYRIFINNMTVGANINNIKGSELMKFKIPLPPLHIQEQIVAEIKGYQKVIDGARQIIENYKPSIKINPKWERKELYHFCNITSGGTPDRSISSYWGGKIPYVKTGLIAFNSITQTDEFITEEGLKNSSAKIVNNGAILMAMYGQGITRGRVAILETDAAINQAVAAITIKDPNVVLKEYLYLYLQSQYEYLREISNSRGGNQSNLNAQIIKSLSIPLPPLEIQKQIVNQIQLEQIAVDGAKLLISIFEDKIKDKISEVWGE